MKQSLKTQKSFKNLFKNWIPFCNNVLSLRQGSGVQRTSAKECYGSTGLSRQTKSTILRPLLTKRWQQKSSTPTANSSVKSSTYSMLWEKTNQLTRKIWTTSKRARPTGRCFQKDQPVSILAGTSPPDHWLAKSTSKTKRCLTILIFRIQINIKFSRFLD